MCLLRGDPAKTHPWQEQPRHVRYHAPPKSLSVLFGTTEITFAEQLSEASGSSGAVSTTKVTTTFTDDAAIVEKSLGATPIMDDLSVRGQSIVDFMAKPYYVGSYVWDTTEVQGTLLTGASFSISSLLSTNTHWANKIQGFNLVRGTACVRVQINANPFQQGKLLCHFLPCEKQITAIDPSYVAMHNIDIATKKQQPNLEIDCRDAVGVMHIPYITPSNWYNVKADSYDWGTFYISVLSPLETGSAGETTVDVSVYVYFEDFELSAPMVPQTFKAPKRKYAARTVSKKDVASGELEGMGAKPISSALRQVGSAANSLSSIPLLAPVAQPVAWAADVASSIASIFGWSKPLNNISTTNVAQQWNRYSATADGPDSSYPLSLRSDNRVRVSDQMSIYNEDEMSFSFLKKVSTVTETHDWSTSDVAGTPKVSKAIGPATVANGGIKTISTHSTHYLTGPPIRYLSSMFALWRGSIELVVKIAKTEFHSGRLQLTWTPTANFTTAPTLGSGDIALREIIDIREGNEFRFNLPYMIETGFLSTQSYSGNLDIIVLNELRGPESVSSSVQLLLYFAGGDDFEFAVPGWNFTADSRLSLPFSPQVLGEEELVAEGVGSEPLKGLTTQYTEHQIGETVTSIKQFLNRYSRLQLKNEPMLGNGAMIYWPWSQSVLYMNSSTGVLSGATVGGDVYNLFASLYAFYRGGSRTMIQHAAQDSTGLGNFGVMSITNIPLDPLDQAGGPVTYPIIAAGSAVVGGITGIDWTSSSSSTGLQGFVLNQGGIGTLSAMLPYYCRTKCSLNLRQTTQDRVPIERSQPMGGLHFNGPGALQFYGLYRSFPDDFQLHYFVGCPPTFSSYT
jgi:hypothetical protein